MEKRNLSDELKKYGYVFSIKRTLILYAGAMAFTLLLGSFFSLNIICKTVLCIVLALFLPFFIRNTLKNRYQQQRFSDLNIYMEQFLYSFQKTGKVLTSLQEVKALFSEGDMYKVICRAEDHILHTFDEENVEKGALKLIENEYKYEGLHTIHHFALQVEKNGGEYHRAISLLLEARRMWADRIYMLLKEKKKQRTDIIMSIVMSLLLCSVIYFMSRRVNIDVASHPVAQIGTLIVLIVDIFIFYRADKRFTADFMGKNTENEKELLESYETIRSGGGNGIFDRLGRKVAIKNVGRAIEIAFPEWLMQVSLLLQSENVQVSIFKSYDEAPAILKPALKDFIEELKKDPTAMGPYRNFLSEIRLPEVESAMKMLYSLSEGTGGEASSQIEDIIRRNQILMDRSEKMKNEDSLAGMYALFLAPQITGGFKLVVDLLLLMVVYMGNMANMTQG
ncbi:MAG: hypothetical protein IIZ61_09870 [Lachnospiraceae bacterium]|nr:hypothetical protein [Lachnospiraceae bacterium]